MKYRDFKKHKIQRTCKEKFDEYSRYRECLQADFHHRCCYCNMNDELLQVSFHIDHFIPIKAFKGKKDELKTDYNNLMWSCPKCNMSKSDKYEGDFQNSKNIENEFFYNPVDIDYNDIFYRNEIGGIESIDDKGKEMIKELKLYRPIHNLAWLIERLDDLATSLEEKANNEQDMVKKELLENACGKLAREQVKQTKLFTAAYKNSSIIFEESDILSTASLSE